MFLLFPPTLGGVRDGKGKEEEEGGEEKRRRGGGFGYKTTKR